MEPAGAAQTTARIEAGDTASEMAGETAGDRDAADQHMLGMVARLDRLIDRIGAPGHSLEGHHLTLAIGLIEPMEFRDRAFLDELDGIEVPSRRSAMSGHLERAGGQRTTSTGSPSSAPATSSSSSPNPS